MSIKQKIFNQAYLKAEGMAVAEFDKILYGKFVPWTYIKELAKPKITSSATIEFNKKKLLIGCVLTIAAILIFTALPFLYLNYYPQIESFTQFLMTLIPPLGLLVEIPFILGMFALCYSIKFYKEVISISYLKADKKEMTEILEQTEAQYFDIPSYSGYHSIRKTVEELVSKAVSENVNFGETSVGYDFYKFLKNQFQEIEDKKRKHEKIKRANPEHYEVNYGTWILDQLRIEKQRKPNQPLLITVCEMILCKPVLDYDTIEIVQIGSVHYYIDIQLRCICFEKSQGLRKELGRLNFFVAEYEELDEEYKYYAPEKLSAHLTKTESAELNRVLSSKIIEDNFERTYWQKAIDDWNALPNRDKIPTYIEQPDYSVLDD